MKTNPFVIATLLILFAFQTMLNVAYSAVDTMPNWTLYTQKGETIRYRDLADKPLILHFWATWCPYCKKLQPGLEKIRKQYENDGLHVLAVSFYEEEGANPDAVLRARGINIKTAIEGDMLARELGVTGTPTTFFVFPGGEIMTITHTSNPEDPLLDRGAQALLGMIDE